MNNIVIFPVIFFFLHTSPELQVDENISAAIDSLNTIYLIKQRWHTAVVFHKEDISAIGGSTSGGDTLIFPEVMYFTDADLIDIGWGDAEFYQHPGFDWDLAYKALFVSTPSTLRVEGIYIPKEKYFDAPEVVIELKINTEELRALLNYISDTVWKDKRVRIAVYIHPIVF